MNDIFFNATYCYAKADAISEVQRIANEVEFSSNEVDILNIRVEQFRKAKDFKIQFDCMTGNCKPTGEGENTSDNV